MSSNVFAPPISTGVAKRTELITCPTHGEQEAEIFRLFEDWTPARCPICESDKLQSERDEEQARKTREEQEQRDRIVAKYLFASGIPPRFDEKAFDNFRSNQPAAIRALGTCIDYAEQFPTRRALGVSVILCGSAGTGKTHLACAIGKAVIRDHLKTAMYTTVGRAFRVVKDTYRKSSTKSEQEAINSFVMPDLLILDEIGVQYGSDSEKMILFDIINERYEALKPTILISNLALKALAEYAGERVIDRMKENGGSLIVFDWKSQRGAPDEST